MLSNHDVGSQVGRESEGWGLGRREWGWNKGAEFHTEAI
jgi:hypothetical protein